MAELGTALRKISQEYPDVHSAEYSGNPLAKFIRDEAPKALKNALPGFKRLTFKGSAGNGNFATVPWLAVFDPLVTTTATIGYYVVFLYAPNGTLFLSLNQGITGVRREFGASARGVLQERASLIRARLPDYSATLPLKTIDLASSHPLPRDYEAGHALGLGYLPEAWPSHEKIVEDLVNVIKAYRALIFRGGFDPSPESSSSDDDVSRGAKSLEEIRQYRMHRRIERKSTNAGLVKLERGTVCEACEFDFGETYGALGDGYIEAHHKRPLSSLEEGVVTEFDIAEDFAVLCSNCHRMIHRMDDVSNIDALRKAIKKS